MIESIKRTFLPHPLLVKFSTLLKQADQSRTDWISPFCILFLGMTGVCFIYSAESYSTTHKWIAQVAWLLMGAGLYTLVSLINYKVYLEYAHIIYGLSIISVFLLWTPLGVEINGSRRWLNLGISYLQPSELAKAGTLILASGILARSKVGRFRDSLKTIIKVILVFLLPIMLIFLQPDLGSSLVFPPMLFALLYVSRLSKRFFASVFVIFTLLLGVIAWDVYGYCKHIEASNQTKNPTLEEYQAILPLKGYQWKRILTFVAPEVLDPKGIGDSWSLRQSLIAVGSGGLLGKGHNNSTQAKLGYLPQSEAINDFIFAVFAEEKGFLGGLCIIILYALLIGNGIRVAGLARDRFGMLLALGSTVIFMIHIFVNIGMTIGLTPITGIPLPFLSYGGSFILSCCVLQGFIQSIYRFRKDFS